MKKMAIGLATILAFVACSVDRVDWIEVGSEMTGEPADTAEDVWYAIDGDGGDALGGAGGDLGVPPGCTSPANLTPEEYVAWGCKPAEGMPGFSLCKKSHQFERPECLAWLQQSEDGSN